MSRHPNLLNRNEAALIIIDVQERLAAVMEHRERVIANIEKLIKGCQILKVPIYYTEQYPKGLGRTEKALLQLLQGIDPVVKMSFSACCELSLMQPLQNANITQVIITGMEAHVCVLQSAFDFLYAGFSVQVVSDAVCSRKEMDWDVALMRMSSNDITVTTTESVLFELTEVSGTDEFKQVAKLVK